MLKNLLRFFIMVLLIVGIVLSTSCLYAKTADIPKTGQSTQYLKGDDGDIQAGISWPTGRFRDNGDGTVIDKLTGLMWLKNANCFGPQTWQDAFKKVEGLNMNPGDYSKSGYTGSYNDWRIPDINELESLINAEQKNVAAWLNTEGFTNVQDSYYWSSTTNANFTGNTWYVYMYSGYILFSGKSIKYNVWPVRLVSNKQPYIGKPWPSPRFSDNGDGTITDVLTGLMWLKNANCFKPSTWKNAIEKVADLNTNPFKYSCGGYTAKYKDWRLPNRKELFSIVDHSKYNPCLPKGHPFIINGQDGNYWSSTTNPRITGHAWFLRINYGSIDYHDKSKEYYIWPVR
ncbi:MAG: DUF1566 domain-containing protein [Desulfobacterales bacterium]|nr:DUF1566 domain-containing protein [Desulfobacterales bacterium]MBF0395441.1 DUF1566 domain-containing protein [Desulfobacterales bacterium]